MPDFKSWSEEYELSSETLKLLADKGFVSLKSVSRITTDILKREFSKSLSVAQNLLLQAGIEALQEKAKQTTNKDTDQGTKDTGSRPKETPATSSDKENEVSLSPEELLNLWSSDVMKSATCPETKLHEQGKAQIFDPLQMWGAKAKSLTKARDIRDYIAAVQKQSDQVDETGTVKVGAVEFSLKETKVSIDKVKISQYMEASLRILRQMVIEDEVDMVQVMQYISYIIKIATLAQSFTWNSVLKYDQEYRKRQAELRFVWGADNAYLMQLYLKPNTQSADQYTAVGTIRHRVHAVPAHKPRQNVIDPSSGKPVCYKWNTPAGCQLQACRYAHVCLSCFATNHQQLTHPQTVSKNL